MDALFDFDESVDNLSEVSEKYAPPIIVGSDILGEIKNSYPINEKVKENLNSENPN